MADTVRARGASPDRVAVINNFDPWVLPPELATRRSEASPRTDGAELRMLYAGNLGRFQNIPRIAEVMAHFDNDPRLSLDIVGDGPLEPWLKQFAAANGLRNIRFHGYVAPARLSVMMRQEFDVGIVSLQPGVIRNAYPSKTLSYLRNGLPVLALVEADSQLSTALHTYGAGRSADPKRSAAVEAAVDALLDDPAALAEMGERARSMYEAEFNQVRQLRLWSDLFHDLLSANPRQLAEAHR
jgi:colanic acid biosynthesis glycosyl transferase WcaI